MLTAIYQLLREGNILDAISVSRRSSLYIGLLYQLVREVANILAAINQLVREVGNILDAISVSRRSSQYTLL